MSYIIQASLFKSQNPEYGQVTVSFPIPNDRYDQTIESLHELEMGFSINWIIWRNGWAVFLQTKPTNLKRWPTG